VVTGREADAAVHLAHDALGPGVHAFGAAVVVGQGQGRVDGTAVLVETADEGVQVREINGTGSGDPRVEAVGVAVVSIISLIDRPSQRRSCRFP
jgi:hypothetical protein